MLTSQIDKILKGVLNPNLYKPPGHTKTCSNHLHCKALRMLTEDAKFVIEKRLAYVYTARNATTLDMGWLQGRNRSYYFISYDNQIYLLETSVIGSGEPCRIFSIVAEGDPKFSVSWLAVDQAINKALISHLKNALKPGHYESVYSKLYDFVNARNKDRNVFISDQVEVIIDSKAPANFTPIGGMDQVVANTSNVRYAYFVLKYNSEYYMFVNKRDTLEHHYLGISEPYYQYGKLWDGEKREIPFI